MPSGGLNINVILELNGPKFRQRCASGKNVAKMNARKPENTRLLLISPAPEPINSTLKIQQEKSTRSLLPLIANTSRHGKHWMTNWPTLSGLVMWMPEALTAASIAGQKMKLSTTTAKTGSVSRHQCANSLMPFATTARLFLALSVNVRSTFTKTLWH
ncbi:hypothetical protein BvCmsSINP006_03258 [Escherichia coli]|nr:hypothetical protein BvCmsSINP006_03258 [Escherichia coli]